MKVLLAIASHEIQHVGSMRSCYLIRRDEQDRVVEKWDTRGDAARDAFVKTFLDEEYFTDDDAILLLDADQRHPEDLLEKLRAHDLDMVCAHYYRRSTTQIQSLCYEIGDGTWPFLPMLHPPKEGLHEIAVTGFGCVLIKKKVLKAVQATLPPGASPIGITSLPEIDGQHDNWGPDFAFFHRTRKLGYKLWLDASVESYHAVTLWLGHQSAEKLINYGRWANGVQELFESRLELHGMNLEAFKARRRLLEARLEGFEQEYDAAVKRIERGEEVPLEEQQRLSIAVYQMQGRLKENGAWIEWAEKYPAITRPDQLPTTESMPGQNEQLDAVEAVKERAQMHREQAVELAEMLPDVEP